MTFKLYYNETGGNSVWSSNPVNVSVSSGIFTYVLRPAGVDWSKGDIWLELTVGANILTPREKLMAQPYSFHSATSEKLYSNNEIQIQVGTTTAYIGVSNNRMYFKLPSSSGIEYLGVPPGTVIAFAGSEGKVPAGYLLCDGRSLNKTDYPELFEAIGTIYGGNGNTFALPNFKGMFLRGNGSNSVNTTPGGTVTVASAGLGVKQSDAIRNITGAWTSSAYGGSSPTGVFKLDEITSYGHSGVGHANNRISLDASRQVPTATENRPVNYSVNYCIKY
jgi:microcystin-dependent protein